MEVGLVLSGGGALGAYQAGVIKALSKANLNYPYIAGTSIGGLNGYLTAIGKIKELEAEWNSIDRFDLLNISPLKNFFFSGNISILKNDFQKSFISRHLDYARLKKSDTELIVSAVCLQTGEIELFSSRKFSSNDMLSRALLATSAIPGIFPPVTIKKKQYVDGGLLMNTPLEPLLHKNLDRIIIIHMSPLKFPSRTFSTFSEVASHSVNIYFRRELEEVLEVSSESLKYEEDYLKARKKLTNLFESEKSKTKRKFYQTFSHILSRMRPTKLDRKLPVIHVIHPQKALPVQSYDFKREKIKETFNIGYKDGMRFITKLI